MEMEERGQKNMEMSRDETKAKLKKKSKLAWLYGAVWRHTEQFAVIYIRSGAGTNKTAAPPRTNDTHSSVF